jgi:HEAT repeat protein
MDCGVRFLAAFFFIAILGQGLAAQEPILNSYERNFMRAGLSTKAGILRDAATDSRAPEFIGQLYEFALVFALQNAELLRDDSDMIAIASLAANGVGKTGHKSSLDTLWKLFSAFRDSQTRATVLGALDTLGKGNAQVIENLNQFLANQNSLYRSGMDVDYATLSACISALAGLGDKASYPVLFSAMTAGYPDDIAREAARALDSVDGNYQQYLTEVIRKNPPQEKLAAFRAGVRSSRFSASERGTLAETALEASIELNPGNSEGDAAAAALRTEAVSTLRDLKWTRATPLAVKYFYRIQADYQSGVAPKERFMDAIACLGAMGSAEAAQALVFQLGFFNSQIERTGEFDEDLTLGVVQSLGEIGAKTAFDYLLYVGYLAYPESIQAAAREALNQLKW